LGILKDRGVFDGAVVVFLSDHGEAMGAHDYFFEHGWFADEAGLRVPLLVKLPGQRTGRRVERPVTPPDVLPLLLQPAGIPLPDGLPGRDPLAPDAEPRPAVVVNCSTYPQRWAGLRDGGWKYLRDVTGAADLADAPGAEQLYDVAHDPDEAHDLAAAQ